MPWTRASELHRTLNCPAAVYLPRTDRGEGDAARWGKEIHTWKETGSAPTSRSRRWAALHEPFWPLGVLWPGGEHEVGLGLRVPLTGRVEVAWSGPAAERFKLGPEWVTGCADWVSTAGPVPHVDDLKTGLGAWSETPPTDQLLFYAAAWARAASHNESVIVSHTLWPRYPLGSGPLRRSALVRPEALRLFESRLVTARRAAVTDHPPVPGPWCNYCPCRTCPHNPGN